MLKIWIGRGAFQSLCRIDHDGDTRVTLLLLLSALLSTLTGSADGVARAVTPQAIMRGVAAVRAVAPSRQAVAMRPVATLPTLSAAAAAPLAVVTIPTPITPIFAGRRRE